MNEGWVAVRGATLATRFVFHHGTITTMVAAQSVFLYPMHDHYFGDCYAHLGKTHTAFIPMREVLRAFFVS
jgi:hypothetical protein